MTFQTTTGQVTAHATTIERACSPSRRKGPQVRLRQPDPPGRGAGAGAVDDASAGESGDSLAVALADEDPAVSRSAADRLGELADVHVGKAGIEAIMCAATTSDDGRVRRTAVPLLASATLEARRMYTEGLRDGDPRRRVLAVRAFAALRAIRDLASAAVDPHRDVRAEAAAGFGGLGPVALPRAVAVLGRLLEDRDHVVRIAALDASAELGTPNPLAGRVATAVADANWLVRKRAVVTLGSIDPRISAGPLIRATHDSIVDVRRAAIRSPQHLAGSGTPEVTAALTDRGVLFQTPTLFPWLTTWQNVLYGPKARGALTPQVREEAVRLLETVGLADAHVEEATLLGDRVCVLSRAPAGTKAVIDIGLPRPRAYEDTETIEFVNAKRRIREVLER